MKKENTMKPGLIRRLVRRFGITVCFWTTLLVTTVMSVAALGTILTGKLGGIGPNVTVESGGKHYTPRNYLWVAHIAPHLDAAQTKLASWWTQEASEKTAPIVAPSAPPAQQIPAKARVVTPPAQQVPVAASPVASTVAAPAPAAEPQSLVKAAMFEPQRSESQPDVRLISAWGDMICDEPGSTWSKSKIDAHSEKTVLDDPFHPMPDIADRLARKGHVQLASLYNSWAPADHRSTKLRAKAGELTLPTRSRVDGDIDPIVACEVLELVAEQADALRLVETHTNKLADGTEVKEQVTIVLSDFQKALVFAFVHHESGVNIDSAPATDDGHGLIQCISIHETELLKYGKARGYQFADETSQPVTYQAQLACIQPLYLDWTVKRRWPKEYETLRSDVNLLFALHWQGPNCKGQGMADGKARAVAFCITDLVRRGLKAIERRRNVYT